MKLLLFLAFLYISAGCVRNTSAVSSFQDGIPVIDVEKVMDCQKQEFLLSDIAYDIEYIPLEFKPECPLQIGLRWDLQVNSSDIFVLSGKIYHFDRSGRFLNSIGTFGRGPGEYLIALGFAVDTIARHIYLHTNEKQVHVYDYQGKHIRSFRIDGTISRGFYYLGKTNELFYSSQATYGLHYKSNFHIKTTDTVGNILFTKNAIVVGMLLEEERRSYSSAFLQDCDSMFAFDGMSDTLFYYQQSALTPFCIFKLGRYKLTINEMRSYHYKEDFGRCFHPRIEGSTPKYLFMNFNQLSIPEPRIRMLLRLDKLNGECIHGDPVITNNLDGGMHVKFNLYNLKNQWIFPIDAFEMIETLTPEYFSTAKATNPEAKQRLQQLVKNLKEEDNPVLMRIILKP